MKLHHWLALLAITPLWLMRGLADDAPDLDDTSGREDEDYGLGWGESSVTQGFVAEDLAGWINDFSYVEMVLYDYQVEPLKRLVESDEIHKGVAPAWTKRLTKEQISQLTTFITGKHKENISGFCGYAPHHGFIFYGKDSKILGHIEICFICSERFNYPLKGLSQSWDFKGLELFVANLGLPVYRDRKDWENFFTDKKRVEQGGAGKPATGSESDSEGSKPKPEAEGRSR